MHLFTIGIIFVCVAVALLEAVRLSRTWDAIRRDMAPYARRTDATNASVPKPVSREEIGSDREPVTKEDIATEAAYLREHGYTVELADDGLSAVARKPAPRPLRFQSSA